MSVKSYLNLPITIYQICFPMLIFPFDCRQGVSSKLPWMTLLGMWNPVLCRTVFSLNLSQTSQPNKQNKREQRGATSSGLWADKWVRRQNKDRIIKETEIKSWYKQEECSQTTNLTSGPLSPIPWVRIIQSRTEQVEVTQTAPPAPGVPAGISSTSAALSGKLSSLHLPDGQLGAGMGRGHGWELWHQPPGVLLCRCSFQIWGLTCTSLLSLCFCLMHAIPINHQLTQLQVESVS